MTGPIAVSVTEAARSLGISRERMYRLLDEDNAIVARYEGTRRLVDYDSLRAYFEALPTRRSA